MRLALGLVARAARGPSGPRAANAGLDRTRRTAGLAILLLPTESFGAQSVFALPDGAGVILQPQFYRVHAQLHRQVVHCGLHAEGRRRISWRTKGASRPGIDHHCRLFHASIRHFVEIGRRKVRATTTAFGGGTSPDARGAVIVHLKGLQGPVRGGPKLDLLKTGRPVSNGQRLLKAGEHETYRRFPLA